MVTEAVVIVVNLEDGDKILTVLKCLIIERYLVKWWSVDSKRLFVFPVY